MSAEPVAMVLVRDHFEPEGHGRFVSWLANPHDIPENTYLYASSPAQARALAIQEAARECERMTERWARRHSPGAMGQMCGLGEGTASECVDAIRALSPAPSVTEEWVEKIAMGFGGTNRATRTQAVYATLAALGVEVKS